MHKIRDRCFHARLLEDRVVSVCRNQDHCSLEIIRDSAHPPANGADARHDLILFKYVGFSLL